MVGGTNCPEETHQLTELSPVPQLHLADSNNLYCHNNQEYHNNCKVNNNTNCETESRDKLILLIFEWSIKMVQVGLYSLQIHLYLNLKSCRHFKTRDRSDVGIEVTLVELFLILYPQ